MTETTTMTFGNLLSNLVSTNDPTVSQINVVINGTAYAIEVADATFDTLNGKSIADMSSHKSASFYKYKPHTRPIVTNEKGSDSCVDYQRCKVMRL